MVFVIIEYSVEIITYSAVILFKLSVKYSIRCKFSQKIETWSAIIQFQIFFISGLN